MVAASKRPGEQTMLLLTLINYLDGQLGFVDGRLGQIAGLDGYWRIKVVSWVSPTADWDRLQDLMGTGG